MAFPFTFSCEEISGSPVEKFTGKGLEATRRFRIPYASRYDFVTTMKVNGFYTPSAYPSYPWSFVDEVTFTPEGAPQGPPGDGGDILNPSTTLPDYNVGKSCAAGDCVAVVTYKPMDIDSPTNEEQEKLRAGTYATWSLGWSGEVQTTPGRNTVYDGFANNPLVFNDLIQNNNFNGQLPEDTPSGFTIAYQDYRITWHHVDAVALNSVKPIITELLGTVNDVEDYRLPGFGGPFGKETLLFMGANSEGTLNSDFTQTRSLTYNFRHVTKTAYTNPAGKVPDTSDVNLPPPWPPTSVGWNHVFISNKEYVRKLTTVSGATQPVQWDRVIASADQLAPGTPLPLSGNYPFPLKDFDPLFAP